MKLVNGYFRSKMETDFGIKAKSSSISTNERPESLEYEASVGYRIIHRLVYAPSSCCAFLRPSKQNYFNTIALRLILFIAIFRAQIFYSPPYVSAVICQ
jgi:hypothetical protein